MQVKVKRGEIYFAELSPAVGSEQNGYRPVSRLFVVKVSLVLICSAKSMKKQKHGWKKLKKSCVI